MQELSGAGGNWQVIDEVFDPTVVQQQDNLSCGPACGEMLLKERGVLNVAQSRIAAETGVPVDVLYLARALNTFAPSNIGVWRGGSFVSDLADISNVLNRLIARGSWAAEMKEFGKRIAHLVVVDGLDDTGRVMIRDPWNGTAYKMEREEFLNYWTLGKKLMNTTVLSIQPVEATDDLIVLMSIGDEQEQFTFTVEKPKQDPFVVVSGDIRFYKFFRFNQHIAVEVSNLVGKIYQGKLVEFPVDVGDFGTPEEAIALQKPFHKQPEMLVGE